MPRPPRSRKAAIFARIVHALRANPRFFAWHLDFDRYKLDQDCKSGGNGTVSSATDRLTGERVAIKRASDGKSRSSIFTEYGALTLISHPNVVRVLDFGYDLGYATGNRPDNTPFLVLEYLDGELLGDLIKRLGSIPEERAIRISVQICDVVAATHIVGVFSRDLKPSNIKLVNQGGDKDIIKVFDFGLAHTEGNLLDEFAYLVAKLRKVTYGTPVVMAPEQARGTVLDERTDVYVLGVILYKMLSGQYPLRDPGSIEGTLLKILNETPAPLRTVAHTVSESMEKLVMACLQKEPNSRPKNMLVVKRELEAC